jgi:hypothetical protein
MQSREKRRDGKVLPLFENSLSHNIYDGKTICDIPDVVTSPDKKPKHELDVVFDKMVDELHFLAKNTNPNIRRVNQRIRETIKRLHTLRSLMQEARDA